VKDVPDTLSAILSRPSAPREKAALYIGLSAEVDRHEPARLALREIDQVTIGRGDREIVRRDDDTGRTLAIALADRRLSTHHARITRLGGRWIVEDLGSKTGTWIGNEAIQQHTLEDGDVIEVGHTMLVLRSHGGEADDVHAWPRPRAEGIATLSPSLAEQFATLLRAAPTAVPIMVLGETGTGKELVARAAHVLSGRKGAFVAVNCGSLPANLVEAELFGHEEGAFTGAGNKRVGLVRSADGGTLFLDEIGELPAAAQAALLRTLQEGEVLPIGADKAIKVDVRLVTATLRDLEEAVSKGTFRSDLLGRLLGITVTLPPLRARREDLAGLISNLAERITPRRGISFTPDAIRALYAYEWPRNIRELERALAAACALTRTTVDIVHLPAPVRAAAPPPRLAPPASALSSDEKALRDEVAASLLRNGGNVTAVARELGKDRTQIRRWMRRFGLSREDD
jgi:sigma-54 dependent transcriptional regulator, acetoin dehydrogenase operon transcriptional activator AcoR